MSNNHIIYITNDNNNYNMLAEYLTTLPPHASNISLEIFTPSDELIEIQSLDRAKIAKFKLYSALKTLQNETIKYRENYTIWIMVDIMGLYIEEFNGFPGPFITYFIRSHSLQNICDMCDTSPAEYIVSYAFSRFIPATHDLSNNIEFVECTLNGFISDKPRGASHNGYDMIFMPDINDSDSDDDNDILTFGEMNNYQKMLINPRCVAFKGVLDQIAAGLQLG